MLASASPRRRDILAQLGLAFEVIESAVDEPERTRELPQAYAAQLAANKASAVAERLSASPQHLGACVLGADTIVVIDEHVLGKPRDDAHAEAMVQQLQGRWHEVITAVALRAVGSALERALHVSTRVRFRSLSPDEVARYVASGEGRDKAGSYAIQGVGTGLVAAIDGSHSNVVGLPASETLDLLRQVGVLTSWP